MSDRPACRCRNPLGCVPWVACLLLGLVRSTIAQPATVESRPMSQPVPADKGRLTEQMHRLHERGIQRAYSGDARTTIGMPCGGICAGQLYVLGDGTLGSWEIDGSTHFTGTGQTSYRTYRPAQPVTQEFAIRVRDGEQNTTCATLDDAGYDAIEFVGEYPRALIRYRAKDKPVPPVDVDLEVFSPFVPLNARDSSWPATVLHFTVRNPTSHTLYVDLFGWLQNAVFPEKQNPITLLRRNQTFASPDAYARSEITGVVMDATEHRPAAPDQPVTRVLADFESGTYAGWRVQGDAFDERPAAGTMPNQQAVTGYRGKYLANSFSGGDRATGRLISDFFAIDQPFLTFRIGGGADPKRTCVNLVVNNRVVRTAAGRNREELELRAWDAREFMGHQAQLEIIDDATGGWGHINVDDFALTNALPEDFKEYDEQGLGFGTMVLAALSPATATANVEKPLDLLGQISPVTVEHSSAEAPFERPLVGHVTVLGEEGLAPGATREYTFIIAWHFPNLHTGHGRMYTNWFKDARDVAEQLAKDLDRLHAETVRFCDSYYRGTTLPWWLTSRLMMPVSTLATGTAQWWNDGRFWAWEGAYCCEGTCTHVWNYAQADAWLFPELARSTRTMQDLGAAFQENSGLVGFRGDRKFAADGQAGTVLKCYREHLTSTDDQFLRTHWSRIKAVLEYLISEDGDDNGIIENDRQHNTYDINFVGPNTFVGALYLAALRAGEEMARAIDDTKAARRYRQLFERGSTWTVGKLWNGEYFEQHVPTGKEFPWQYGRGCLSDQLFGQNWAHTLGLGYLYPQDKVRSALAAVYKHNWTPDVGPLNEKYPPERWFARPGEPGLFVCTWPRGGRPAEPVRYRDEVWTGIEYEVAAGLAWEGMVDEALTVVHGVDERYDGAKHNPWNEVECGDHYARALASWGVLHALAGFTFDGPAGRLRLAPRLQQGDFACFFCAGTGWGNLVQRRVSGRQTNAIELKWGMLRLRSFITDVPEGATVKTVAARQLSGTDSQIEARGWSPQFNQDAQRCEVAFDTPVDLKAGEQLEVALGW